jgi:DNA-binding response OmpR family regulator
MDAPDSRDSGRRRRVPAVLVVEDDVACRGEISATLKEAGFVVIEAGDGAEALRLLLTSTMPPPMVIVLDLRLPIMSGPEFLKILKGYHRFSQIPVILTSAGPAYKLATSEMGWLAKPFDGERLVALVTERCRQPSRFVAPLKN